MRNFQVGDMVRTGNRHQDVGKVVKIIPVKSPSPGGIVLENSARIWYVAPWEHVTSA